MPQRPVLCHWTTNALNKWRTRAVFFLVCFISTACLLFAANVHQALAIPAKPPTDWSFYITSIDVNAAYTHGCNQGQFDASVNRNSEVVLAFGAQTPTGTGTYAPGTSTVFFSNDQIEVVAQAFSSGYWHCTGTDTTSQLTLGIWTSNYANSSYANGQVWANVVKKVQDYNHFYGLDTQVKAIGANVEPSWGGSNSFRNAGAWADGFHSVTTLADSRYINFGSADGCSQTESNNATCNNGWHQFDVWYVSWGAPSAFALPEIYYPAQAQQWAQISLYGYQNHGQAIYIYMEGPLDQNGANGSNTSDQAWSQLWTALNMPGSPTAQDMRYSAQIHWQQ